MDEVTLQPPAKRRRRPKARSSLFSGTSTEFLGSKSLPCAVRERPILFLFGPKGVGKSMVARHFLGDDALLLRQREVMEAMALRILLNDWPWELAHIPKLAIEAPCFIDNRPSVLHSLGKLVGDRLRRGLRTAVLDAEDGGSVKGILNAFPLEQRATVILRFPVGGGRYRFLARECRDRGLPLRHARRLARKQPWTYRSVLQELDRIKAET